MTACTPLLNAQDRRWEVVDGNVWALEILTALIIGPLCLLMIYGIVTRKPWRHTLQLVICVCELVRRVRAGLPCAQQPRLRHAC